MTLTALVVPTDGMPSIVEIPQGDGFLRAVYDAIHCNLIEVVEVLGLTVFIDEEGKYTGPGGRPKPTNVFVTRLALDERAIFPTDWVCGDAIFMGPADDEGETTGLTADQLRTVQAALAGAPVAP